MRLKSSGAQSDLYICMWYRNRSEVAAKGVGATLQGFEHALIMRQPTMKARNLKMSAKQRFRKKQGTLKKLLQRNEHVDDFEGS